MIFLVYNYTLCFRLLLTVQNKIDNRKSDCLFFYAYVILILLKV